MSRTHPRGCLTSSQRPPSAAVHRQCRAALGGGGAEDWVGGRCRHRSTAGGGAYARRMAGGITRARRALSRGALVLDPQRRHRFGSTSAHRPKDPRSRFPRCGAASRRSLGLCSLLLQRHRSCAVLLAAARVPGRTAAFSSPLRVLSSRHPPCLSLDHVHALDRLHRSTRSRSSTRLGCTGRPAHFK